jgi:aspartyl-tRNA synthetase
MSFVDQDDVRRVAEDVLARCGAGRLRPADAAAADDVRRGDGPLRHRQADLRMGQELVECTDYFKDTPFRVFQAPYVGAVVMPEERASRASSSTPGRSGPSSAAPAAWPTCWSGGRRARRPVAKNLSEDERQAGGPRRCAAGRLRLLRGRAGQEQPGAARRRATRDRPPRRTDRRGRWSFLWVVDAPLFEPPTRPPRRRRRRRRRRVDRRAPRLHLAAGPRDLRPGPGDALAWAYDIVCNGNEIGGGRSVSSQ